jgi:hypothetical protein
MELFHTTDVSIVGSAEQCEGWVEFRWSDPVSGWEALQIEFEGFCSRRMPLRSGSGLQKVDLSREALRLWLSVDLASKLGLGQVIEIAFRVADDQFAELQRGIECISLALAPRVSSHK